MASGQVVGVRGARELRRDLRQIDRQLPLALNRSLRAAMQPTAARAAQLAPKRTGRLAGSLRPFASGRSAGIRSSLPYANAIHWGWRKHHIEAHPFVLDAIHDREDAIVAAVAGGFEALAVTHGFR